MSELRRLSLVLLCLSVPFAIGCGGGDDDDDDSPVPIEQLPAEIAGVFCADVLPCLGSLSGMFLNGADCEDEYTAQFTDQELARWQAAIDAGTLVYHADKARACLDAFAAAGCTFGSSRMPAVCEEALEGTVAMGGDCNAGVECAGVAYCKFDAACPGTCTALEAAGAACEDDDNCQDGLACMDGECAAPGEEGDSCGAPDEPDCQFDLRCAGADEQTATSGTCQPIEDLLIGDDGDTCDLLGGGPWCKDGLSCVLESIDIANQEVTFQCQPGVASGAACRTGFPDPCPDEEMCDADPFSGQIDGTCISLPDDGEPCADVLIGEGCAPGLACVGETCTQIARIGGACTVGNGCYSGTCDGDACAAPPLCEYDP